MMQIINPWWIETARSYSVSWVPEMTGFRSANVET
jgi:hypothetical protein